MTRALQLSLYKLIDLAFRSSNWQNLLALLMKLITRFCETYQVLMRRTWRFFRSTTQLLCRLRLKVADGVGFKLQVLITMKRQQILDQAKRVLEMKRLFQQSIAMGKVLTKSEDTIGRIYQGIGNADDIPSATDKERP